MSTLGDVQYIRGYHDACGDTMSTSRDTMSTSGGYMSTSGGYHEYIGGFCSTLRFSIEIERFLPTCSPTCIMISPIVLNIPQCTHDIP